MVADAIGGAIRAPDTSNPGTRPNKTQQFLVGSQIRGKQNGIRDAIGVAVMMALYTLIIARCLKEPEWQ